RGAPRVVRLRRRHARSVRVAHQQQQERPRDRRSRSGRRLSGPPHAVQQHRRAAGEDLRQASQDAGRRPAGPGAAHPDPRAGCGVHDSGLRVRAPGNSLAAQAGGRDAMTGLYRLMLVAAAALTGAAPVRADAPGSGEVTAVSLAPAAGKTEIIVAVKGAVDVRDFLLASPDRLVLDVVGATLGGTPAALYDGVKRGGVLNLRYSQFRPDVVRIVVELEAPATYTVDRSAEAIRVSFGSGQPFQAWSSTDASARAPALADAAAAAEVRPVSAEVPARKLDMTARSAAMLTRADEPRITVTWDRASIADVVAGFAAFSGRTIILGKDVKGEVNAEIKNQPWPQAFQAILATQGLSAQEMSGGIIRVDAPSALAALDSLEPLETSIVRINYAKAKELTKSVEGSLTKGRGNVIADDNSNSLILTDTRS